MAARRCIRAYRLVNSRDVICEIVCHFPSLFFEQRAAMDARVSVFFSGDVFARVEQLQRYFDREHVVGA